MLLLPMAVWGFVATENPDDVTPHPPGILVNGLRPGLLLPQEASHG